MWFSNRSLNKYNLFLSRNFVLIVYVSMGFLKMNKITKVKYLCLQQLKTKKKILFKNVALKVKTDKWSFNAS